METRFDPFQEFEGVDDRPIHVLAALVIAQGGLSAVAGIGKAARAECSPQRYMWHPPARLRYWVAESDRLTFLIEVSTSAGLL